MGKRRLFLGISGVIVALSVALTVIMGPKFGIDFVGGTELQVRFAKSVTSADIRKTLTELGFPSSDVVTFGQDQSEYLIRIQAISPVADALAASSEKAFKDAFKDAKVSKFEFSPGGDKLTIRISKEFPIEKIEATLRAAKLDLGTPLEEGDQVKAGAEESGEEAAAAGIETTKKCESVTCTWPYQDMRVYEVNLEGVSDRVLEGIRSKPFGVGCEKMRSEWVGPKVGKQLREAGIWSIVYALLFIMIYIAVRFDLRFAPGAVVALIHDIFITVGVFTLARVEVTLATVAALLTIVGYSLNDTIVVFDRIRENINKMKERKLSSVINISINQTLSRTILTSLTTLLVVVSILTIGWRTTIRDFAFALLIGVLVGTYSSIFIASPVVVWLDTRFSKKKS